MLLRDRRGYSMTFWAVFIGLVMIPALALAIELGRYFYAISEVAKAADAAAVAASAEINQKVFQDTGSLIPTSKTWGNAQSFVTSNTTGLSAKGVHAFVANIQVNGGDNTVRVSVSADLSILFPSVVPRVVVTQTGVAKLRAFTHNQYLNQNSVAAVGCPLIWLGRLYFSHVQRHKVKVSLCNTIPVCYKVAFIDIDFTTVVAGNNRTFCRPASSRDREGHELT